MHWWEVGYRLVRMLGKRLGEIERLSERMGAGIEMGCRVEG